MVSGALMLSVDAAALRLGISASYLNKLRLSGGGPPFAKIGTRVVYDPEDLTAWVGARKMRSTSDVAGVAAAVVAQGAR